MRSHLPPPTLPVRDGVGPSCVVLPAQARTPSAAANAWVGVLDFLEHRFPAIGRAEWTARMARGDVIDAAGAPIAPERPYTNNLRVYYYRQIDNEPTLPFEEAIVYQDAHLVVADKPHFMPVVPSGRFVRQSLLVRLKQRLGIDSLVPIHRIDRDTAGLVLFSVQPASRGAYHALFREHAVVKTYEAIAVCRADRPLPAERISRIVEDARFFRSQEVPGEPNAHTQIRLLEQRGDWGRYALAPVTGKKHQLRLHMAALGLPIRNDPLYPELLEAAPDDHGRPLQLLARSLAFDDPLTGAPRRFESGRQLDW